jgi:hypothetical protein
VQLLACLIWRGFERRWNTDHLGHSDRIGFELAAHQDEPAKEHGAYDKKVDQNWHSHRCLPTKRDWENLGRICLTLSVANQACCDRSAPTLFVNRGTSFIACLVKAAQGWGPTSSSWLFGYTIRYPDPFKIVPSVAESAQLGKKFTVFNSRG